MSKSKTNQKLAEHLGKLLTSVQDRTIWLSEQFRKLADQVAVLAQKQRNDTAVLQQVDTTLKSELTAVAAAHNRLRFEFDYSRFGQSNPVAGLRRDHDAVAIRVGMIESALESFVTEAGKTAGTIAGEKFMELTAVLRDEVDRLRTLSVTRTDRNIAEFNTLYDKVAAALQKFNERVSKLEGIEQRLSSLEHASSYYSTRITALEQPREIRLLVVPSGNPEGEPGINPGGNNTTRIKGYESENVYSAPTSGRNGEPGTLLTGVPHS